MPQLGLALNRELPQIASMHRPEDQRQQLLSHWISIAGPELLLEARLAAVPPGAAPEEEDESPEASCTAAERLARLADEAETCQACPLGEGRQQSVFADGSADSDVFFIGEGPGAEEDRQGLPFVGQAGQLLTRIIEGAMGRARESVYIANVVKCRPPNNRNPEPTERSACAPFLEAQIEAVAPKILICLGSVAARHVLSETRGVGALRGRCYEYRGIPVVVTWHPAYLLRRPEAKRETWQDIQLALRTLGADEHPRPYVRT